jgi:methionine-rich copper-binding protein CopC
MRRALFALIAGCGLAFAAPAAAQHSGHESQGAQHSGDMLAASAPADGAVLNEAPRTLTLTFAHPVMLQRVAITGPNGAPVQGTFRRAASPTASYAIALPELADGAYEARWSATGQGHAMDGVVRFSVQ